jgi:hypothetical protein
MVMKYLICLIGLILNSLIFSQDAPQVSKFTVDAINGKVYLNWTIEAGGTCNGIGILRSTDSLIFQEVGLLEGVCGSLSFPTNYSFTDDSPLENKTNYYKLDLGGNGFSQIVGIEVIIIGEEDYVIFSNPLSDLSVLHFKNETNQVVELSVYDANGSLCLVKKTDESKLILEQAEFPSKGIYRFMLSNSNQNLVFSGKIVVQ